MLYHGVEFVENADLPPERRYRICNGSVIEAAPREFKIIEAMAEFEASVAPKLASLDQRSPMVQEFTKLCAPITALVAEMRQAIDEARRLPPVFVGYGVATIGDWTG
jgi:hypothetical protein